MKPQALTDLKERAVQQAIETIRNRIDQLGVTEPIIQEHGLGQYQILVQLPGVDDPARVKEIMQSTAMLEIRQAFGGPYPSEQAALQANRWRIAARIDADAGQRYGPSDGGQTWYFVSRLAAVTGRDLRDAGPSRMRMAAGGRVQPTVKAAESFTTSLGPREGSAWRLCWMAKSSRWPRSMSRSAIPAIIKGRFTEQEVKDQSMVLRSGALPASIKYLEERTVGPSLGTDSIRAGVTAAVIGMVAVLIFMLVYYHGAGINADLALILNLIILLGFMGYSGATLTLPGIAGVILTVGMGVDSNVLIFERIREELRNGKTPPSAVDRASACLDHHRGYPRHDHRFGGHFVHIRHRPGEGIRRDADLRFAGEPVYGGFCFANDF